MNDMEKTVSELQSENERLRTALEQISNHLIEIQKLFDQVSDLLKTADNDAPLTNEGVKNLLQKYSRL